MYTPLFLESLQARDNHTTYTSKTQGGSATPGCCVTPESGSSETAEQTGNPGNILSSQTEAELRMQR